MGLEPTTTGITILSPDRHKLLIFMGFSGFLWNMRVKIAGANEPFFAGSSAKKSSLGGPCGLHFATVVDLLDHPLAVVPGCIGDKLVTLIDAVSHGGWPHIR